MADFTRSEEEGVLTVTFTRESKRNAMNRELWAAVEAAAHDLSERRAAGVEHPTRVPVRGPS
jgi:enoyl-CoA hydratase/carnithine racemase